MLVAIRPAKGESPVDALSRLILYPVTGMNVLVLGEGMWVWVGDRWQESDASVIVEVSGKERRSEDGGEGTLHR